MNLTGRRLSFGDCPFVCPEEQSFLVDARSLVLSAKSTRHFPFLAAACLERRDFGEEVPLFVETVDDTLFSIGGSSSDDSSKGFFHDAQLERVCLLTSNLSAASLSVRERTRAHFARKR